MDSDDCGSMGTASTDTSMFLRELQALNTEGAPGPLSAHQSLASNTSEVAGSGDAETLPQALKTMIGPKRPAQIINLAENADEKGVGVYNSEVEIYAAPISEGSYAERSSGSNKVKVTTVVKHVWELKYYHGNLVAVHRDADFVAYVLRGQTSGNVRVISRKTAHRVLLKTFTGNVLDIAFALSDDVYLAAVDETGSLFIHSFIMDGDYIISKLVLHVKQEMFDLEPSFRSWTRVIWCPYMPDEDYDADGPDVSKMLVLLHGSNAEVWNVDMVAGQVGPGPVSSKGIDSGVMVIESEGNDRIAVVNASFAPDGSAIGVAYHSGAVKFHMVDLSAGPSECMHEWVPHQGEVVTSLYFLDDHRRMINDQQLWKFALTGAKYNTEIKIWSCETWTCVQTLMFNPPIWQPELKLQLKSGIDLTSKYCTLSDINSGVLYVMQLHTDYSRSAAHVTSLSQFTLAQPCVSCAIFDAGVKKFRHSLNDSHLDEITTGDQDGNNDDEEDEEGSVNGLDGEGQITTGVQIKMYGVHTKCLQELLIRYRPETSIPPAFTPSIISLTQEDQALRDMLSDMSMDQQSEASQDASQPSIDTSQPLLMTPDAFTSSPSMHKSNGIEYGDPVHLSGSSTSSFTQVTAMNDDLMAMDSPRNSVEPSSIMSPSSTFVQTPSQCIASPSVHNSSLSGLPLPPITSAEEDDLATPKNRSFSATGDLSLNTSVKSNQEILDHMFSGTQDLPTVSGLGQSIESCSSTGSFPVTSIKSAFSRDERYDENDKEVAQALGETPVEGDIDDIEDKSLPEMLSTEVTEERSEVVWPEPPNVSTEAKRLVNEAIQQSTIDEEEVDEDDNDEGEVEEIIQHIQDEEEENDGDDEADDREKYQTKRSHRHQHHEHHEGPSIQILNNLDNSIAALAEQLKTQQEMMQQMQTELNHQREIQLQLHRQQIEQHQLQQMAVQQPSLEKDINKLEDLLVSRMEHSLAQHMQRETNRLQDSLKKSDAQRLQRDNALQTSVVNDVSRAVKDTVGNTLRTEIKQTVNPALHRFVEPMKEKIHQEVAQRLTACDSLLKDNISKAVKSRSTMDVLATSVGDVIYQQMQQAYTDTFQSAMLPTFKATMEKTVRDVHGVFQQGTKEYQLYLRQNVEQMVRERSACEDIVERIEQAEQQFLEGVNHLKSVVLTSVKEELTGQVSQAISSVKKEIVSEVRKIMKEEVSSAIQEHGASINDKLTSVLRSGAATPVPFNHEEENNKERILRDLKAGRINEAFQSALSASNLDLVMFVCESSGPLNIFSTLPIPLSQPVLLSLISQLSANLDKNFDLKMKFLEESVVSLDPSQPMTADHIPGVLGALVQRLKTTNAHSEDGRKVKRIKLLIMAANSVFH